MSPPDEFTRIAAVPAGDEARSEAPTVDDATRVLSADALAAMRPALVGGATDVGAGALPGTRVAEFEITRDGVKRLRRGVRGLGPHPGARGGAEGIPAHHAGHAPPTAPSTRCRSGSARPSSWACARSSTKRAAGAVRSSVAGQGLPILGGARDDLHGDALLPGAHSSAGSAASGPGGVDEAWLLAVVDGVSQALGVMHAAHCFHRDIAPDNIVLLDGSDRPVVLDFGAARRVISDKTQAITVILETGLCADRAVCRDAGHEAGRLDRRLRPGRRDAPRGDRTVPPPSVGRVMTDGYVPLVGDAALSQRFSPALLAAIDAGLAVRPEARPQSMADLRALLGLDGATADAAATVLAATAPGGARMVPGGWRCRGHRRTAPACHG